MYFLPYEDVTSRQFSPLLFHEMILKKKGNKKVLFLPQSAFLSKRIAQLVLRVTQTVYKTFHAIFM